MWRVAALLCCLAGGAASQTVEEVSAAIDRWLRDQGARGVMAIQPADGAVAVVDLGLPADEPVGLASLSKAITAVCMAQLVREGAVRWSDPVSRHVPGFDRVVVADLITHQGGIVEDATQRYMGVWLDDPHHRSAEIVEQMRKRGAPTGPRGIYAYSNDNYALAAQVIEVVSGQSYAEACHARALDPAGVSASPSERGAAFLSWGGWAMTVDDYLRFHAHWFDTQQEHLSAPAARFGGSAVYGLGMLSRPENGAQTFWHFGALCFPGRLSLGTYVVAFFNDWRVVVAYDACVSRPAMAALDRAVTSAILVQD